MLYRHTPLTDCSLPVSGPDNVMTWSSSCHQHFIPMRLRQSCPNRKISMTFFKSHWPQAQKFPQLVAGCFQACRTLTESWRQACWEPDSAATNSTTVENCLYRVAAITREILLSDWLLTDYQLQASGRKQLPEESLCRDRLLTDEVTGRSNYQVIPDVGTDYLMIETCLYRVETITI